MESTLKTEILYRLKKIETAVQRLITQNEEVKIHHSPSLSTYHHLTNQYLLQRTTF